VHGARNGQITPAPARRTRKVGREPVGGKPPRAHGMVSLMNKGTPTAASASGLPIGKGTARCEGGRRRHSNACEHSGRGDAAIVPVWTHARVGKILATR